MDAAETGLMFAVHFAAQGLLLLAIIGGLFTLAKLQRAGLHREFARFTWITIAAVVAVSALIFVQGRFESLRLSGSLAPVVRRWISWIADDGVLTLLALGVVVCYLWQIARHRGLLHERAAETPA